VHGLDEAARALDALPVGDADRDDGQAQQRQPGESAI